MPAVGRGREFVLSAVGLIGPARARGLRTGTHGANATDDRSATYQTGRDVLRGLQWRQPLQPQAGFLTGVRAKLVRLNDLIRFANACRDHTDGVLKSDVGNRRGQQQPKKRYRLFGLRRPPRPSTIPVNPTRCQVSTRRVPNQNGPPAAENIAHVALIVGARHLRWQQVARDGIDTARARSASRTAPLNSQATKARTLTISLAVTSRDVVRQV